jgi:IS30 family transposase
MLSTSCALQKFLRFDIIIHMPNRSLQKLSPVDSEVRNTVIHILKNAGLTTNSIARIMNRNASTISRILDKEQHNRPLRDVLRLG